MNNQLHIKGLELSRQYYREYGAPLIDGRFAAYKGKMAVGLVGQGSECFGFDDALSRDHDYGPGFCIWLSDAVYQEIGKELQAAYDALPKSFLSQRRVEMEQGQGRVGVLRTEVFYSEYIGMAGIPQDNLDWFRIPESFLAVATNGDVFFDWEGRFTEIRNALKGFYPADVWKKKLAARAGTMAQAGQYNYPRCVQRGDYYAAYLACYEFVHATLSAVFLMNKRYMPFYKWAFRMAEQLEMLQDIITELKKVVLLGEGETGSAEKTQIIEQICIKMGGYFNQAGLSTANDSFLIAHGESMMQRIEDARLKGLPLFADCR